MSQIAHADLVRALVKPPVEIVSTLSIFTTDLWHGATGVAGEAGELLEAICGFDGACIDSHHRDIDNIKEELGDLEFYMEQLRQRTGLVHDRSIEELGFSGEDDMVYAYAIRASIQASAVLDTCKKAAIYNKPLDVEMLKANLFDLDCAMEGIRQVLGISREETIEGNIEKLRKRYGEKYSDAAAHARADKASEPTKLTGKVCGLPDGYTVEQQADGSWGLFKGGGFMFKFPEREQAICAAQRDAKEG